MISFVVPVRTRAEGNNREHWRRVWSRRKEHRTSARLLGRAASEPPTTYPLVVRMTRVGKRRMDDDNLMGALKGLRDGIADWLGVDDGRTDLVRYEYAQRIGKTYAVEVVVLLPGEVEAAQ